MIEEKREQCEDFLEVLFFFSTGVWNHWFFSCI